jgi:hypothetical protein
MLVEIAMTDTTIPISNDLGDPDPTDLDRLAASLNHLRAHFCQAVAENDPAPPSLDVCERVVLTSSDGDSYLDDLDQPAVPLVSVRTSVVAEVVAGQGNDWVAGKNACTSPQLPQC